MKFFNMGLRRHDLLDEMGAEDRVFNNDLRLRTYWKAYHILSKPYTYWGTMYRLDMDKLKKDLESMDLSGEEWNDYDSSGHPYWDYQWHVDANTGDAWRLVKKENK